MNEPIEKLGFALKHNTVGELFGIEIIPIIDAIEKLGVAADGFGSAARTIAGINITEQHQIKELLKLIYDIRRSAEDLQCLLDKRLCVAIKAVETGIYDAKNVVKGKEEIDNTQGSTSEGD
ncbi:MAG: hypothetical protein N2594_01150 [Clostridiales bacterium]|nr:hypothetical protein [Clostridiales bacterium]